MSKLISVSWNEMVKRLRELVFVGLSSAAVPILTIMKKEDLTVDLPNPHKQDIGIDLLKKVLKRAEINREEWLSV